MSIPREPKPAPMDRRSHPPRCSFARLVINPVEKVGVGVSVKVFSADPIVWPFALMTPER